MVKLDNMLSKITLKSHPRVRAGGLGRGFGPGAGRRAVSRASLPVIDTGRAGVAGKASGSLAGQNGG